MDAIKNILFVCTGNCCRSPFAEYLLRRTMTRSSVHIHSAGTHAPEGARPPLPVLAAARPYGLDLINHSARQVSIEMIAKADLILAMSHAHLKFLQSKAPDRSERLFLLSAFGLPVGGYDQAEIPDPVGHSDEVYHDVFEMIAHQIRRIRPWLESHADPIAAGEQ